MEKLELLAPAGTWASFVGAINAGADAVYLAGKRFGARAYAGNFDEETLIKAIEFAHLRGRKVYVTINTLIYDDEIDDLLVYADFLVEHYVDALIVQDIGMLNLFLHRYPDTDIHASTQMNVMNVDQARFLKKMGVARIILARETSLSTIKEIKKSVDIELEVFVHGALCVSYSGQCLFSSMIGGRSGNRGECAQPCRLAYSLLKEDEVVEENTYLLSTKDLMTLDRIDELAKVGIASLKIEGRMRKSEYVIQTVLSYRHAIDYHIVDINQEVKNLKKVFNRDYTEGYLFDIKPKTLNHSHRPNHMGIEIGKVVGFDKGKVTIDLTDDLVVGDGIRFVGSKDYGLGVSRILKDNQPVQRAFANEQIVIDSPEAIEVGSIVHKTMDSELESSLSSYLDEAYKCIPLKGIIRAYVHQPLSLKVIYGMKSIVIESDYTIVEANNKPVTKTDIDSSFSKLGNTPFEWQSLTIETDEAGFIPVKIMNELRRQALELVTKKRLDYPSRIIQTYTRSFAPSKESVMPYLVVSVRTLEQYNAAKASGIDKIWVDESLYEQNSSYFDKNIVLKKRRIGANSNTNDRDFTSIAISEIGGINRYNSKVDLLTDEYMNVTNAESVLFLLEQGIKRVTLSNEMTKEQIISLQKNIFSKGFRGPYLEKVVYGREQLMVSKYCPIAKTYDTNLNCQLCRKNQYYLKDRMGVQFPLINDGLCNIIIHHQLPLNLIEFIPFLIENGISSFRLNFTVEDSSTTQTIIHQFLNALNGNIIPPQKGTYTLGRFLR